MKQNYLVLSVVFMFTILFSCSSGGNDEEYEKKVDPPKATYSVCLHNDIDVSKINKNKYNGNIEELYLVTVNTAKFYNVTSLLSNGTKITYTLPDDYEGEDIFTIYKYGGTEKEFCSLDRGSSNKIMVFSPKKNQVIDIYFTEDSKFSIFPYTKIEELKSVIQSLVK